MIPRIVHFCHFYGTEYESGDISLPCYVAIKSAIRTIDPTIVYFYNTFEPVGKYWELIRPLVKRVHCIPPKSIFGNKIEHYAHRTDVLRLILLIQNGGIYLDLDTVCCHSFDSLLKYPCVLGLQSAKDRYGVGLCNAVILSEPESSFLKEWLDSYRTFDGTEWDIHSVRIPYRMAKIGRNGLSGRCDLHIEPSSSFFSPGFEAEELKRLFERSENFPDAFCHHLWEGFSNDKYLSTLTENIVNSVETTYNCLARPYLRVE